MKIPWAKVLADALTGNPKDSMDILPFHNIGWKEIFQVWQEETSRGTLTRRGAGSVPIGGGRPPLI